jgi:hypothetical protein
MALRITRSASLSSRSISSQVLSAASAVDGSAILAQQLDRIPHALATLDAEIGQTGDLLGHVADVIQGHGLGRVLDQVRHIVHGVDQGMDLLAIDRGDEGPVDGLVHILRHTIGRPLGIVHVLVVLFPEMQVVVVRHQLVKTRGPPRRCGPRAG